MSRREEVTTTLQSSCFLIVNLPSVDVARSIFKRAVLVKGVYLFLSSGRSYEEVVCLHPGLFSSQFCNLFVQLIESLKVSDAVTSRAFSGPDQPWCCEVECFGHSLSVEEKEARRLLIAPIMGFQGPRCGFLPRASEWHCLLPPPS